MSELLRKETRSQTLIRYTRAMLRETSQDEGTFTLRLIETYHRLVPSTNRNFKFRDTGDLARDLLANTQRVRRWIAEQSVLSDGRLCVDLEEAWAETLLEPYRSQCRADLVRRHGFLPVPLPCDSDGADVESVSRYMREVSDPIPLVAEMLEDGRFCPEDRPMAEKAKRELWEAVAAAMQLIKQIDHKVYGEGVA